MRNRDIFSSLVWVGVGIAYVIGSLNQGLLREGIPGPGFLPFLTALFLITLSSLVFISALLGKKTESGKEIETEAFFPEKSSLKKIFLGLVALFFYFLVLDYLGFLLTTFVFMLFTSKIMAKGKWVGPLILAILCSVLSYILFVVLLDVLLPKGILGI